MILYRPALPLPLPKKRGRHLTVVSHQGGRVADKFEKWHAPPKKRKLNNYYNLINGYNSRLGVHIQPFQNCNYHIYYYWFSSFLNCILAVDRHLNFHVVRSRTRCSGRQTQCDGDSPSDGCSLQVCRQPISTTHILSNHAGKQYSWLLFTSIISVIFKQDYLIFLKNTQYLPTTNKRDPQFGFDFDYNISFGCHS